MVEEFDPVRIATTEAGPDIEKVHLFSIDDDDYYIPHEVPPQVTIRLLRELAEGVSHETAVARAMRDVLGADAMDALADTPDITKGQMDKIMGVLERMVLAAQEDTVGKRRPVPRR
jgi:hypothetical protein